MNFGWIFREYMDVDYDRPHVMCHNFHSNGCVDFKFRKAVVPTTVSTPLVHQRQVFPAPVEQVQLCNPSLISSPIHSHHSF